MSDWKEIKLKSLVAVMGDGGTPSTQIEGNFGGDIPWVVVDDIVAEIFDTKEKLTELGFKKCSAKLWDVGTIILSTGATIGNVGIAKVKLCTKQGITGIVCNEFASNLFLRYWFEKNTMQLLRFAQGTTFKEIRTRTLGNIRIKIPNPFSNESITEQTAIATILSKVDEAIKATQDSIKAAEKLKKSLMQNLLTGKLKPDGTWRTEEEFYIDEKFGEAPLGWVFDRFKNRIVVQYGKSQKDIVSDNGTIPIYGTGGIIEYGTKSLCNHDSILIGRKGTIDKPFFIDVPFWAVDTTYYVESFKNGNMKFLFYLLQRKNLKSLNEATGVPSITRRTLNNQIFLFPPPSEQIQIVNIVDIYDKFVFSKQTKIQTLQRLKKSLMQNLLTGKVRVNVDKINELLNTNSNDIT